LTEGEGGRYNSRNRAEAVQLGRYIPMERENILRKIEEICGELAEDRYEIMKGKILERTFHLHKSARNPLSRKFIEKFRTKLMHEVELVLGPVLDNQREINLRFLDEIERLRQACISGIPGSAGQDDERPHTTPSEDDQT